MPFPFTFRLPVPGLTNPFYQVPSTPAESSDRSPGSTSTKHPEMMKITRQRPSPILSSPEAPLSRKRGWEPTFAETSRSTTTLASSNGYLDTPAKYRDIAAVVGDDYHEVDMVDTDTGNCRVSSTPCGLCTVTREMTDKTLSKLNLYFLHTPHALLLIFMLTFHRPTFSLMSSRVFLCLDIEMPPPAKRRRGLAGSIVSTALSAALIGTAVGLTVYRL